MLDETNQNEGSATTFIYERYAAQGQGMMHAIYNGAESDYKRVSDCRRRTALCPAGRYTKRGCGVTGNIQLEAVEGRYVVTC